KGSEELPSLVLKDRRKLARTGIVVAWLVLDVSEAEIVSGPNLLSQGVFRSSEDEEDLIAEASEVARQAIMDMNLESRSEPAEVAETMRRAVRRFFYRELDSKPVVVPIVHDV
ncbi:MAG: ribonuclease J, partial [Myxococcales bacterium]|nr:ribonuclease J [Myxococcales bacterium]